MKTKLIILYGNSIALNIALLEIIGYDHIKINKIENTKSNNKCEKFLTWRA
jgi:hypothetical protein